MSHDSRPLAEQILDRCAESDSGCWEFGGALSSGYGVVNRRGRLSYTHRVVYAYMRAEIPEGLHLDHLCRNRVCVNPDHLEPVTALENARRIPRDRCKRGHPRTPENLYQRPDRAGTPGGMCRQCIELRWKGAA